MKGTSSANFRDYFMEAVFFICAAVSIVAVALICYFLFASSIPAIEEIGLGNFLTGEVWKKQAGLFGVKPMIVASIYVTLGAAIIGVPIGLLSAIYLAFYCPQKVKKYLQAGVNLMAGIPSVVYGLWALNIIVPWVQSTFGGYGLSMLAAIILLGIMILPTVISLSQSSLEAVPKEYYQGAIGMGATHERAIFTVVLPAASSGVLSAAIMGIGRAIGETMAVQMVIGNQPVMPDNIVTNPETLLNGARTLTTNIVTEMSYAAQGIERDSLIATGAVLFVFILIINFAFNIVKNKEKK